MRFLLVIREEYDRWCRESLEGIRVATARNGHDKRERRWRKHAVLGEHFREFFGRVAGRVRGDDAIAAELDDLEWAVLTALAVLGLGLDEPVPVPGRDWLDAVTGRVKEAVGDGGDPPDAIARTPEFVADGWLPAQRLDRGTGGAEWDALAHEAGGVILQYIEETVEYTLRWLGSKVYGFPADRRPDRWAREVFDHFTSEQRCPCWMEAAGVECGDGDDVEEVVGQLETKQQRDKAHHCMQVAHHLLLWVPAERTLWDHIQRAVKGVAGPLGPKSLPSGMLWAGLLRRAWDEWGEPDAWPLLRCVNVAVRDCPRCGEPTMFADCKRSERGCDRAGDLPPDTPARFVERVIVDATIEMPHGGAVRASWFREEEAWQCANEKCRHVFPAAHCRDLCGWNGRHDHCPLCGTAHRTGKGNQQKTRRVYFFESRAPALADERAHRAWTATREQLKRADQHRSPNTPSQPWRLAAVGWFRGLLATDEDKKLLGKILKGNTPPDLWRRMLDAMKGVQGPPDEKLLQNVCEQLILPAFKRHLLGPYF